MPHEGVFYYERVQFSLSDPPFLPGDLLKLEGGDRVEEYFLYWPFLKITPPHNLLSGNR